jgi:hypothetical protein
MKTTYTTARDAAESIVSTYDDADQFRAVAVNGCGEWELDRASEIADESDTLTTGEIVGEIETICADRQPDGFLGLVNLLRSHGDMFTGNAVGDMADEWLGYDFDAKSADGWMDIGVWEPSVAAQLRDADLTPAEVKSAADALEDAEEDAAEVYTDGSVIYSICNSDTSIDVLLNACAAK